MYTEGFKAFYFLNDTIPKEQIIGQQQYTLT